MMKTARMNILHFRFILFNLKFLVKQANHYQSAIGLPQSLAQRRTSLPLVTGSLPAKVVKSDLAHCVFILDLIYSNNQRWNP